MKRSNTEKRLQNYFDREAAAFSIPNEQSIRALQGSSIPMPRFRRRRVVLLCALIGALLLMAAAIPLFSRELTPKESQTTEDASIDYRYSILRDEKGNYLCFDEEVPPYSCNGFLCRPPAILYFASIEEMKDAFLNQTFTEKQLEIIAHGFPKDEEGKIRIPDFDRLFVPQLPADVIRITGTVDGRACEFSVQGDSLVYRIADSRVNLPNVDQIPSNEKANWTKGYFLCCAKEDYDTEYLQGYVEPREKIESIGHTVVYDEERDATIYTCTEKPAAGNPYRLIQYTIHAEGKTLHINENYRLIDTETIEEIPSLIQIYGYDSQQDAYFIVFLTQVEVRPSIEWLSSFGVTPYEEAPSAAE